MAGRDGTGRFGVALTTLALIATLVAGGPTATPQRDDPIPGARPAEPLVIGHRWASGYRPEHTRRSMSWSRGCWDDPLVGARVCVQLLGDLFLEWKRRLPTRRSVGPLARSMREVR